MECHARLVFVRQCRFKPFSNAGVQFTAENGMGRRRILFV